MHARTLTALAVCAVAALAGCSGADAGTGAGLPAQPPAASGDVVLTVDGPQGAVDWDLAGLRSLPQVEDTLFEPFLDEDRTFTGPAWSDVLRVSGIDDDDAGEVRLVALDDYQFTLSTDPDELAGAILALEEEGDPIPLEEGGPIRLVFSDESTLGEDPDAWVWSVRSADAG